MHLLGWKAASAPQPTLHSLTAPASIPACPNTSYSKASAQQTPERFHSSYSEISALQTGRSSLHYYSPPTVGGNVTAAFSVDHDSPYRVYSPRLSTYLLLRYHIHSVYLAPVKIGHLLQPFEYRIYSSKP